MKATSSSDVTSKTYTFAITLTQAVESRNVHDQLYDALLATDGSWYQSENNEPRCIQFVRKGDFLICRSIRNPPDGIALEEVLEVSNNDYMQIEVRLPKSRRTHAEHPRGKGKSVPLHHHETTTYFKDLLSRHGMGVLNIDVKPAYNHNVFFKANGATVDIQTCNVTATVKITDAKAFESAYLYGVGRYKTYGCGMIQPKLIKD